MAGYVTDFGISGLMWIESKTVVGFTIDNSWRYICAGFVGWGWLLRNHIPSLLCRFTTLVGVGGIVIELVRTIITRL